MVREMRQTDVGGEAVGAVATRPARLAGGTEEEFRDSMYRFLTLSVRMDRLREQVGLMLGLSGFEAHILLVLSERGGTRDVSVGMVADALHVTGAYVTMETRKLAHLGLVEKRSNPSDRRGILLSLTPQGRAAVAALAPAIRQLNDALFEGFEPSQYETFRDLVGRLLPNAERALRTAEKIAAERA